MVDTMIQTSPGLSTALSVSTDELQELLSGFWAHDRWDMAECPLLPDGDEVGHTYVTFDHPSHSVNVELKYACCSKFNGGGWSPKGARSTMGRVRPLLRFLKAEYPDLSSLLEMDLEHWVSAYQAHVDKVGAWVGGTSMYVNAQQQIRVSRSGDARLSALREIYRVVDEARDRRPEYEKDVWDVRRIAANPSPADVGHSLNFTRIPQPWLRVTAKRYLRYRLSTYTLSTCRWDLNAINRFAEFLDQQPEELDAPGIDRQVITQYLSYLASAVPGARGRQQHLAHLRLFFETCTREEWAAFPKKPLIVREDTPRRFRPAPRTIPEHVLHQLNQFVPSLPEPYRTMAIVIQETGLRVSELCTLPLDCLIEDQDGDWFLRHLQWKMKREHTIPITLELAGVIQEQQQRVVQEWEDQCSVLFPNGNGKPVAKYLLSRALNRLAVEKNICDSRGELFRFRMHDFRHTVATRMLRGGVRQHHVQKYLGHESPEMTMVYAEITDQDLKKAYQGYQELSVDITGRVVSDEQTCAESSDLQWFKRNIMAQALPHGFCAIPVIADSCPVPNACLTCANFRTDARFLGVLKQELEETEKLITKAEANGWIRQVEMNRRVADNLRRVIRSLEEITNDSQEEC
jgi:integrase/recombinase XerD